MHMYVKVGHTVFKWVAIGMTTLSVLLIAFLAFYIFSNEA